MDDYIFRRELDFSTNFPEMIVQLKTDRQFCKMELAQKMELYDEFHTIVRQFFLSDYLSVEEKNDIEKAVTQQMLERAQQEWEKVLIKEGYYDG